MPANCTDRRGEAGELSPGDCGPDTEARLPTWAENSLRNGIGVFRGILRDCEISFAASRTVAEARPDETKALIMEARQAGMLSDRGCEMMIDLLGLRHA